MENEKQSTGNLDALVDSLTCSINQEIFYDPVVAEDGQTYEKHAIEMWIKNKDRSPMNGNTIGKTLVPNHYLKKIVAEVLTQYPHLKELQFDPSENYNLCKAEVSRIVKDNEWDRLRRYKSFVPDRNMGKILAKCPKEYDHVIIHIVEHITNWKRKFSCSKSVPKRTLLHNIAIYRSIKLLQYTYEKCPENHRNFSGDIGIIKVGNTIFNHRIYDVCKQYIDLDFPFTLNRETVIADIDNNDKLSPEQKDELKKLVRAHMLKRKLASKKIEIDNNIVYKFVSHREDFMNVFLMMG